MTILPQDILQKILSYSFSEKDGDRDKQIITWLKTSQELQRTVLLSLFLFPENTPEKKKDEIRSRTYHLINLMKEAPIFPGNIPFIFQLIKQQSSIPESWRINCSLNLLEIMLAKVDPANSSRKACLNSMFDLLLESIKGLNKHGDSSHKKRLLKIVARHLTDEQLSCLLKPLISWLSPESPQPLESEVSTSTATTSTSLGVSRTDLRQNVIDRSVIAFLESMSEGLKPESTHITDLYTYFIGHLTCRSLGENESPSEQINLKIKLLNLIYDKLTDNQRQVIEEAINFIKKPAD